MKPATLLAAEAQGHIVAAQQHEKKGEYLPASRRYKKASSLFTEAGNVAAQKSAQINYNSQARVFQIRAESLKNTAEATKAPVSQTSGTGQKNKNPVISTPGNIPDISFDDIGGLEEAKTLIKEAIIYPFTRPDLYAHYGIEVGKGALFYGPPGTGKTLLGKAAANECNATFVPIKASTILSKFVGDSEQTLREIFEAARECERCILFFDELDALAGSRTSGGEDHSKRLVDELLAQMDGVDTAGGNVLCLGATNAPWTIDMALRRPGRFSSSVLVSEPDLPGREAILRIHTATRPLSNDIDLPALANYTTGYTGAELAEICRAAAMIPLSQALLSGEKRNVTMQDFRAAIRKRGAPMSKAWYQKARKEIPEEERELFPEIFQPSGLESAKRI